MSNDKILLLVKAAITLLLVFATIAAAFFMPDALYTLRLLTMAAFGFLCQQGYSSAKADDKNKQP